MATTFINDWQKFGATVRSARLRHGLTQQVLAERAGVSRAWLARFESGHRAAEMEQTLRLLAALGLQIAIHDQVVQSDAFSSVPHDAELRATRDSAAARRAHAWSMAAPPSTGGERRP